MEIEELYRTFLDSEGINTDTRELKPGQLYFALKGANHDGNRFAREAIEKGAKGAVIDDPSIESKGCILVEDGLQTLQKLAQFHRQELDIPIIAITGSNGKTTTKELVARVLSRKFNAFATRGNLNNLIGLPLSLLSIKKEQEIALLEFGADRPGENRKLAEISEPTHGLVTNIGLDHLEGFKDKKGVYEGNKELMEELLKKKGHGFFHIDDPWIRPMMEGFERKSSYGRTEEAELQGKLIGADPFIELEWWKKGAEKSSSFKSKLIGDYNFPNILAALCIGDEFGVAPEEMEAAIAAYEPDNKRSQVLHTEANSVILDAYNANPTSMEAALESFIGMESEGKPKSFILGDMLEMGSYEEEVHERIVRILQKAGLTDGLLVGTAFQKAAEGSGIRAVKDLSSARKLLREKPFEGRTLLVKGSRGIRLEELMEFL